MGIHITWRVQTVAGVNVGIVREFECVCVYLTVSVACCYLQQTNILTHPSVHIFTF